MTEDQKQRDAAQVYPEVFGLNDEDAGKPDSKVARALQQAFDVRKFEIGLYWQRTTYFWAFITSSPRSTAGLRIKGGTRLRRRCGTGSVAASQHWSPCPFVI
jgi:hypothetical protein